MMRCAISKSGVLLLAGAAFSMFPTSAKAQWGSPFNPNNNPFNNPFFNSNPFGSPFSPGMGIGNAGIQQGGVTRATSSLANPINFYQYGQITGVAPIRGTVAIYNQFGLLAMQGNNSGFGSSSSSQLPGQGTTQGDDPPQGVLLHVNYANMFLPNQQQINGTGGFGQFGGGGGFSGGGFGGFGGGFPGGGGFGKGAFGNGASGL
jgi:hypothetical protein